MEWVLEVFSKWEDVCLCGIGVGILVMLGEIADALTRMRRKSREPHVEPEPVGEDQGGLKLIWREDEPKSYSLPTQGQVVIGRAVDCDIILRGRGVSRYHARVEVTGPEVVLVDLDSTNGTFVGSQKIGRTQIYPGDNITIGGYTLGLVERDNRCRVIRS